MFSFMGFPRLQKAIPITIKVEPDFAVGVNQIELAAHGSQDYRFLPGLTSTEHRFINITASIIRWPFYRAEARLNPAAGNSFTSFQAIDGAQRTFFPCVWRLFLYLRFEFDVPFLAPLRRRRVVVFNKDPLVYETEIPLTGFPPLNAPALILKDPVDFFDERTPEGRAVMKITKPSKILPINRILYDIKATPPTVTPDGSFKTTATIGLTEPVGTVRTAIALIPTRGVTLHTAELQHVSIGKDPLELEIVGQIDDLMEEHLGVTVRPYSVEPRVWGFGRAEIDLPSQAPSPPLAVEVPPVHRVRSGENVELRIITRFGREVRQSEFIWVAPHGITLENATSPTPTFVAPRVTELTDIWFTLYVRDGDSLSRPYKIEVQIAP
jgi:hypothetical protein